MSPRKVTHLMVRAQRTLLHLEQLDDRIVPYAVSGYKWGNLAVSASFMPDGAITDSGYASNLFATLNTIAPTANWQLQFARALQTWADASPLNFHLVSDNGAMFGSSGLAQGDSRFGDIRLGGSSRSDSFIGYGYFPSTTGTEGGDEFLNTTVAFHIGSNPDLYSLLLHETGHAIGLDHSTLTTAVMYPNLMGVYSGLSADDIAGIQSIYGSRKADAYDTAASNNTFSTATSLSLNGSGAASISADLTSMSDVDYYRFTAPSSGDGTFTISVDARNLSLFDGKVSVYDSLGNLVATNSASTYGGIATLSLSGLTPGQPYTVGVTGATTDVFGMGAYKLNAQFGGITALPTLSIGNVSQLEGNSGTTAFNFNVTLSAPSTSTVTVQYATGNGTASSGTDYTTTSGTLTFAPGQTQQTVTVLVNGDTVYEPNETFTVSLSSPTNATLGTTQGIGTIQNDDIGPDRFETNDTLATATRLGKTNTISQAGLTLHTASDVDDYTFTPAKSAASTVTITPTQGGGTTSVTLLNASQVVVASGQSSTGSVVLTANLVGNKQYYLKVWSTTGNVISYNLTVGKSGGGDMLSHQDIADSLALVQLKQSNTSPTNTMNAVIQYRDLAENLLARNETESLLVQPAATAPMMTNTSFACKQSLTVTQLLKALQALPDIDVNLSGLAAR